MAQYVEKRTSEPKTNALFSWQKTLNCALVLALVYLTRENWLSYIWSTSDIQSHDIVKSSGESTCGEPARPATQVSFSWDEIEPSQSFVFMPCFDGFECARLEVPMDRHNEEDVDKVVLAMIKLPAKVPVTDPRYGGVVFLSPGGPGVSGVGYLQRRGKSFQTIIDTGKVLNTTSGGILEEDHKFYDALSWDPRGIGSSTPPLNCFPDSFSREIFYTQFEAESLLETAVSNANFEQIWAREKALGQQCAYLSLNLTKIARHMNTPAVVMDLVDVIERYGEWREKEAKELIRTHSFAPKQRSEILKRARWTRGAEKLQFWGVSYGTHLGATFATMQSHRVHRMILDGVMDTEDYYNVTLMSLENTDAIMIKFAEYCHAAGPEKCAFYTGDNASDITAALEALATNLSKKPLVVAPSDTRPPDIITSGDLMRRIIPVLYNPYSMFEGLAKTLQNLRCGDGSMLADEKRHTALSSCTSRECDRQGPFSRACRNAFETVTEAEYAIACSDGVDITGTTRDQYRAYEQAIVNQSRWMGGYFASYVKLPCVHWTVRPAWEWREPIEGKTAFPILFLSTRYDPVTALSNAHTMSRRFPGSVVAEQLSEGHCTMSSPSLCTARLVGAYFQKGRLPDPGTTCLPDAYPFGLSSGAEERYVLAQDLKADNGDELRELRRLKEAVENLSA